MMGGHNLLLMLLSNFKQKIIFPYFRSKYLFDVWSERSWSTCGRPDHLVYNYISWNLYHLVRLEASSLRVRLLLGINSLFLFKRRVFHSFNSVKRLFISFFNTLLVKFLYWLWNKIDHFMHWGPFILILSQQFKYEIVESNRILIRNCLWFLMHDVLVQSLLIVAFERMIKSTYVVETTSHGPHVNFLRVGLWPNELGGHEEGSSHVFTWGLLVPDDFGHAQIPYFNWKILGQENIHIFEISVDDVLGMQVLKAKGNFIG